MLAADFVSAVQVDEGIGDERAIGAMALAKVTGQLGTVAFTTALQSAERGGTGQVPGVAPPHRG
jgi:hypothetical protein